MEDRPSASGIRRQDVEAPQTWRANILEIRLSSRGGRVYLAYSVDPASLPVSDPRIRLHDSLGKMGDTSVWEDLEMVR
jgi:hypothetical protein